MSATASPDPTAPARGGWWARASAWSRFQAVALTVFVVGHVALQMMYVNWYIEDAAISFAFAKHLAIGEGLVAYPGGERVEGYSNPTWTFLMAAFHLGGVDGFWSSKIMAAVFGGATVLLTWDIARRTRGRDDVVPLVAAFLLALNPQFVIWAASGLENSLFCFFLALGVWLVLGEIRPSGAGRFPWSSVAFFGLAITRPEGILYAAVAGFWAMVFSLHAGRGVAPTLKWLFGFFAPFGAYNAVRYAYFAWEFPNTYYSKLGRADYDPENFDSKGWKYVRDWAHELWQGWLAPVYVIAMVGFERGLTLRVRGRAVSLPIVAWLLLLLAVGLLLPGPQALVDLGWPKVPVPQGWNEYRVWVLAAMTVLALGGAIGRPAWQSLVLNGSLLIVGLYFAIHAGGDWMRGFRWVSLFAGPQAVLFAMGVAEIADAVARRWPPRGEVAGWVWGLSRAWNLSWSLPAGVAATLLVGVVVPPDVIYLEYYTRKSETNPYKIQRRVNYMHYVQNRLHLEHVVSLDVDMGGTMWWSGHEIVDIAGLVDVPIGHHGYQKEFVREYIFEERRPHFAHLHGGWEKKMGVKALPEYERTYFEIPGYPTGRTSVHVGNRIRKDLFLASSWTGPGGRFVEYGDGIAMHGFDVPQGDATPGRSMYVEVGWSAAGREKDPGFRVIAFVRQGDVVKTWDVAPGYDWYTVDLWKPRDVVFGKYSLRLPKDLPTGSYEFGLVTFGRDGAVAIPLQVPAGAEGGAPDDAAAAVARGELRWAGLLEVVSKEQDEERLKDEWETLVARAGAGDCEDAEAAWDRLRVRRSDDWRWQDVNRPKLARHIGSCWVARAEGAVERAVKVEHLARARWWDHWTPGLAEAARPVADALYAEGKAALDDEDWETAYRRFTDVLRIDASRSWARRHAETARDKRLGIDAETVEAKAAEREAARASGVLTPRRIPAVGPRIREEITPDEVGDDDVIAPDEADGP